MPDKPLPEFMIPQTDSERSHQIAMAFSELHEKLHTILASSRERSLVTTKLQEAHFFAQIAPRFT